MTWVAAQTSTIGVSGNVTNLPLRQPDPIVTDQQHEGLQLAQALTKAADGRLRGRERVETTVVGVA